MCTWERVGEGSRGRALVRRAAAPLTWLVGSASIASVNFCTASSKLPALNAAFPAAFAASAISAVVAMRAYCFLSARPVARDRLFAIATRDLQS